jgi:hypothetical protein
VLEITIMTEKSGLFSKWQLDHVSLLDMGTGKECAQSELLVYAVTKCSPASLRYLFPYGKWIASGESTERIAVLSSPPCRYTLSIQTAYGLLSGTSSEIRAILHGRLGQEPCVSQPLLLKHKCDDAKLFSRGSLNVFSLLSVCDIGELRNVELLSDGSGVTCFLAPCMTFEQHFRLT